MVACRLQRGKNIAAVMDDSCINTPVFSGIVTSCRMCRNREHASRSFAVRIPIILVIAECMHHVNAAELSCIQCRKISTPVVECRNVIDRISCLDTESIVFITALDILDRRAQVCGVARLNIRKDKEIGLRVFIR